MVSFPCRADYVASAAALLAMTASGLASPPPELLADPAVVELCGHDFDRSAALVASQLPKCFVHVMLRSVTQHHF